MNQKAEVRAPTQGEGEGRRERERDIGLELQNVTDTWSCFDAKSRIH